MNDLQSMTLISTPPFDANTSAHMIIREKIISFVVNGIPVLELAGAGAIYVQGRLAANDEEVVAGLRAFFEAVSNPAAHELAVSNPAVKPARSRCPGPAAFRTGEDYRDHLPCADCEPRP